MDIGVDFDGTCVTHNFPEIGTEIGATRVLRRLVREGHNLILFTMRSNQPERNYLTEAVGWFEARDIPLYGVQSNPSNDWSDSPKAYANVYIDDSALGCPLVTGPKLDRVYVDWSVVESRLTDRGILTPESLR